MTTYRDYEMAVRRISSLAQEKRAADQQIQDRLTKAAGKAHDLPRLAVKQTEAAKTRIQQQQSDGRFSLQQIDQEDLLPARVRPGRSSGGISAPNLDQLVAQHADAVRRLQQAVTNYEEAARRDSLRRQEEAQREAIERSQRRAAAEAAERRRREEQAEAARLAGELAARRHQLRVRLVGAGALAVLILIVVLLAVL